MVLVWIGAYVLVAFFLMTPFRVSSAESRREEEELKGESK